MTVIEKPNAAAEFSCDVCGASVDNRQGWNTVACLNCGQTYALRPLEQEADRSLKS